MDSSSLLQLARIATTIIVENKRMSRRYHTIVTMLKTLGFALAAFFTAVRAYASGA